MKAAHFEAVAYFPHDRRCVAFRAKAPTELGARRQIGPGGNVRVYRVAGGRRTLVRDFGA